MAGQADKKARKAATGVASTWGRGIMVLNVFYLCLLGWRYKGGAFAPSYRYALGMGLNTLLYYVSYQGLVEAASSPALSSASMYIDLLGLTVLVQFTSLYSHYAWYLHLIVPAMLFYKYALPLLGMLKGAGGGGEAGEVDAADEAKRLAKKERRASRGKVIH